MDIKLNEKQIFNFWEKVPIQRVDECWPWKGSIHCKGYGEFRIHPFGKNKSHRISWVLTFGEIPEGLFVCHKCDNRKCCNPYHLFLGTAMDNWKDCVSKDRQWKPKGEKNPSAKLNQQNIIRIRNLHLEGFKQVEIAKMFKVGKSIISAIIRNEVWK